MSHSWVSAVALALAGIGSPSGAQTGLPGGAINEHLGDYDYGVCRGVDPACYHNWTRPADAVGRKPRILLYTRTGASRHAALGPLLPQGLNPPLEAENVAHHEMVRLATANGWDIDYTEDVSLLGRLTGYNAVVFLSTSRDILDDTAKTALRQYMRAGGGFVAIHNAFGTLYNWPYYEGLLGGANFYDHGPYRDGEVVIVDGTDATTAGFPSHFAFKDEWYNLVPFPTRVKFLATVDEKSWSKVLSTPVSAQPSSQTSQARIGLEPVLGRHPGHGDFHPVAWCQYYDGGKVWATTLGHDGDAYKANSNIPGAKHFQQMITNGIASVMGLKPFCS